MFQVRLSMLRLIVLPALQAAGLGLAGGCRGGPTVIPPDQRTMIGRQLVEYPAGVDLQVVAEDLTGPVDCAVDKDGTLIVAESGRGKYEPRIYAIRKDGTMFNIYPTGRRFPQPLRWL